jgi:hypothetical protein
MPTTKQTLAHRINKLETRAAPKVPTEKQLLQQLHDAMVDGTVDHLIKVYKVMAKKEGVVLKRDAIRKDLNKKLKMPLKKATQVVVKSLSSIMGANKGDAVRLGKLKLVR